MEQIPEDLSKFSDTMLAPTPLWDGIVLIVMEYIYMKKQHSII